MTLASRVRRSAIWALAVVLLGVAAHHLHAVRAPGYLSDAPTALIELLTPPPPVGSPAADVDLEELLRMQASRTPAMEAAAVYDKKLDAGRFWEAAGILDADAPGMADVQRFFDGVEADIKPFVNTAKKHFARPRPFAGHPAVHPCFRDVGGDSFPSGHSTFAWTITSLLSDLLPERRSTLQRRAAEYARQRVVCGVHYPSDIEAGRIAGEWLASRFLASAAYQADAARIRDSLRAAAGLAQSPGAPSARSAGSRSTAAGVRNRMRRHAGLTRIL